MKTKLATITLLLALLTSCGNGTTGGGLTGDIVPGSGLAGKLAWLEENAQSGGSYIIELDADESTPTIVIGGGSDMDWWRANLGQTSQRGVFVDFGGRSGVTVALRGRGGNRAISLSPDVYYGYLFIVTDGVTLVLDNNITLKRRAGHESTMVIVGPDATLVMNPGSAIDDSNAVDHNNQVVGGGVHLHGTFTMNGGSIFNGGRYGVVTEPNAVFTMNGGSITGKSGNGVSGRGFFTMNGGTISGNGRGGVYVGGDEGRGQAAGTFIMTGGSITGNAAGTFDGAWGGGVAVGSGATFNMSGGSISGNSAVVGGGVYVGGTFTMSGGTISGNSATVGSGGGVYTGPEGIFNMRGGTISGNTSFGVGGGVLVISGVFTKTGGAITGGGDRDANVAEGSDGHAVYANTWNDSGVVNAKYKNTTSGPSDNLSYNAGNGTSSGAWDE